MIILLTPKNKPYMPPMQYSVGESRILYKAQIYFFISLTA